MKNTLTNLMIVPNISMWDASGSTAVFLYKAIDVLAPATIDTLPCKKIAKPCMKAEALSSNFILYA